MVPHLFTELRAHIELACTALPGSADLWLLCCLEPYESVVMWVLTALSALCPPGPMPLQFYSERQHCMVLLVHDFAFMQNSVLTQVEVSTHGLQVHQNNSNDCLSGN